MGGYSIIVKLKRKSEAEVIAVVTPAAQQT